MSTIINICVVQTLQCRAQAIMESILPASCRQITHIKNDRGLAGCLEIYWSRLTGNRIKKTVMRWKCQWRWKNNWSHMHQSSHYLELDMVATRNYFKRCNTLGKKGNHFFIQLIHHLRFTFPAEESQLEFWISFVNFMAQNLQNSFLIVCVTKNYITAEKHWKMWSWTWVWQVRRKSRKAFFLMNFWASRILSVPQS